MRKVALVLAVGAVLTAVAPADAADNPVEQARRATQRASFTGIVRMRWTDEHGRHDEVATVQASGGVLVVRGGQTAMADGPAGLIAHDGEAWELLAPPGLAGVATPDPAPKYDTTVRTGPAVAGHPTLVLELTRHGAVRERQYVAADSGLVLRRDELDAAGNEVRSVAFEQLAVDAGTPAPRSPAHPADHRPRPVAAAAVGSAYRAPDRLEDGFRRLGVYRRDAVLHVLYGDGVYEVSVFEQRGRLDRTALPAGGERVAVGPSGGWRYSWPGGQILVWQAGRTVYTAVGDAPIEDMLEAARSLHGGAAGRSLGARLRSACRALVESLRP